MKDETCAERIEAHYKDRMDDLRKLWAAYQSDDEENEVYQELGRFEDYGLCLDYCDPAEHERESYLRYQLSYGGPQDEFRFFLSPTQTGWRAHRIEYWFLDWFDGASIVIEDEDDRALLMEIYESWEDGETVAFLIKDALRD